MIKTILLASLVSFLAISCAADAGIVPVKSMDACKTAKETLVCGIVAHRGLILYRSECEARAAGADRILQGPCDESDD